MISPARPGFGKSDSKTYNNLNDRIDGCVRDIYELLNHLGIEKVYLLTGWAAPIAQRFAIKYPDMCKGLILSGAVPAWRPEYLNSLQPRYLSLIHI